jgi:hypothetical protein
MIERASRGDKQSHLACGTSIASFGWLTLEGLEGRYSSIAASLALPKVAGILMRRMVNLLSFIQAIALQAGAAGLSSPKA